MQSTGKGNLTEWDKSQLCAVIEKLDGIIADKKKLYIIAMMSRKKFDYLLEEFTKEVKKHPDAPDFLGDKSLPDDRYMLRIRHALLLGLFECATSMDRDLTGMTLVMNPDMAARYIGFASAILQDILPTAARISQIIRDARTVDQTRHLVSGANGGEIILYETHTPLDRETDEVHYPGRKITCMMSSTMALNSSGLILAATMPRQDLTHNPAILSDALGPLSRTMKDPDAPETDRVTIYGGEEYPGIGDLPGILIHRPAKSKNSRLNRIQKNAGLDYTRVKTRLAERLNRYKVLINPYNDSDDVYNENHSVVTGLANFELLWDEEQERPKYELLQPASKQSE